MQLQGTMGSSVRYPAVLKVAMTQSKRQQGQEDDCVALYDEDSMIPEIPVSTRKIHHRNFENMAAPGKDLHRQETNNSR